MRHLSGGLVVSPGVSNHRQKSQPPEDCQDLVSRGSRNEAASSRSGSSGSSKLQHSSLASIPGQYNTDTSGVSVAATAHAASKSSPWFSSHFYDIDVITLPFVSVLFHLKVRFGAT